MTAFDCSGVKPFASRRWATLRVSKFVERVGALVLKWVHLVDGPRAHVEAMIGRTWRWDDGGWSRGGREGSRRGYRDMVLVCCGGSVPRLGVDPSETAPETVRRLY